MENYILVNLGLRPCSQMTRAQAMGSTIDRIVSPILSLLRGEADPRRRTSIIKGLKDEMRDAYQDIVKGSEDFKAHQS